MCMDSLCNLNPFGTNFTKWSNTLKQFVGNLQTNCLTVFDHFVGLALKELSIVGKMSAEKEMLNIPAK